MSFYFSGLLRSRLITRPLLRLAPTRGASRYPKVDTRLMAVDYLAPVAISKGCLQPMLTRRSGHIVVVSSGISVKHGLVHFLFSRSCDLNSRH